MCPSLCSPNISDAWTPHGTSKLCPWIHMQYFMQGNCYRSQNLSSKCLLYPHQQFGETKSLCKVDSTYAQRWPKSRASSSCHYPSAALEIWRQCIPPSHINGWWVMNAFIWPLGEMTERRIAWPNVIEDDNCTAESGCSESHSCHVLHPKWTWVSPSCACWYYGQWPILLLHLHPKWGRLFAVNNQICLSMVSLCSRTMKHLIKIMMCKIWCNTGTGMCWHIISTLQISPHEITSCLNMCKNILGVNELNRKMISTLLSLPLYIVWARMNTQLHLIVYHTDGKCVLVITLSWGHTSKHSGVSVLLLSCIVLLW